MSLSPSFIGKCVSVLNLDPSLLVNKDQEFPLSFPITLLSPLSCSQGACLHVACSKQVFLLLPSQLIWNTPLAPVQNKQILAKNNETDEVKVSNVVFSSCFQWSTCQEGLAIDRIQVCSSFKQQQKLSWTFSSRGAITQENYRVLAIFLPFKWLLLRLQTHLCTITRQVLQTRKGKRRWSSRKDILRVLMSRVLWMARPFEKYVGSDNLKAFQMCLLQTANVSATHKCVYLLSSNK